MKVNRAFSLLAAILLLMSLFGAAASAQQDGKKKSYTFHGKVEAVDAKTNKLTVNGEEVKGWMSAMTMAYGVDKPETVKTIKVGDQIEATVYDNDMTLHNVKVVGGQKK